MASFKLCYVEHEFELNYSSIRDFKQATGLDLYACLLGYLAKWFNVKKRVEAGEISLLEQFAILSEAVDFETASHVIKACTAKSQTIGLDEIQNAMFNVGWLPVEEGGEYTEPYTVVLAQLGIIANEQLAEIATAKKREALGLA